MQRKLRWRKRSRYGGGERKRDIGRRRGMDFGI